MFKIHDRCLSDTTLARFLEERTEDREESRVLAHLDRCPACQTSLAKLAAGDEVWHDIQHHLDDDSESLAPATVELGEDGDPRSIVNLLGPTDDPRMLGRLGGYEICGVIGQGGAGIVVKGYDARLNRFVAIKILSPAFIHSGAARQRFEREGRAVAAVTNEHVVPVYGVDEDCGLPFIVMRYIAGGSLQQRIDREGPLETCEVVRLGMQIAGGLAAAHRQGIVHRDVKPANVLLEHGGDRAMVTDFGLARVANEAAVTQSGFIAGTPQYMSPEQARGEPVDQRSDLFSLGSVLYTACTGRAPFDSESVFGMIKKVCESEPREIREINPRIEEWLVALIRKLHHKDREQRFDSAEQVHDLLAQELAYLQSPTIFPVPSRTWLTKSRFTWRRGAAALSVMLIIAAVFVAGFFGFRDQPPSKSPAAGPAPDAQPLLAAWQQPERETNEDAPTASGGAASDSAASDGAASDRAAARDGAAAGENRFATFEKTIEKTYDAKSGGTLYLDTSRGSVKITTHDAESVFMRMTNRIRAQNEATADELFKMITLSNSMPERLQGKAEAVDGTDVAIVVRFPDRNYSRQQLDDVNDIDVLKEMLSSHGLHHFLRRVSFELMVPKSFNLNIATAGGRIDVPDLRGSVALRTAGGPIELGSVVGSVVARTSGGKIEAANIDGPANVRTSGGSIRLGDVTGDVEAVTAGGSIHLGHIQGSTKARTSGGSISVDRVDRSIDAVTSAGEVRVNFGPELVGKNLLKTSAGSVKVGLYENTSIDIEARASRIRAPFIEGKTRKFNGAINGGGPRLRVNTTVGTIQFDYIDAKTP